MLETFSSFSVEKEVFLCLIQCSGWYLPIVELLWNIEVISEGYPSTSTVQSLAPNLPMLLFVFYLSEYGVGFR